MSRFNRKSQKPLSVERMESRILFAADLPAAAEPAIEPPTDNHCDALAEVCAAEVDPGPDPSAINGGLNRDIIRRFNASSEEATGQSRRRGGAVVEDVTLTSTTLDSHTAEPKGFAGVEPGPDPSAINGGLNRDIIRRFNASSEEATGQSRRRGGAVVEDVTLTSTTLDSHTAEPKGFAGVEPGPDPSAINGGLNRDIIRRFNPSSEEASEGNDDPNGGIVIIGRDGPSISGQAIDDGGQRGATGQSRRRGGMIVEDMRLTMMTAARDEVFAEFSASDVEIDSGPDSSAIQGGLDRDIIRRFETVKPDAATIDPERQWHRSSGP